MYTQAVLMCNVYSIMASAHSDFLLSYCNNNNNNNDRLTAFDPGQPG